MSIHRNSKGKFSGAIDSMFGFFNFTLFLNVIIKRLVLELG